MAKQSKLEGMVGRQDTALPTRHLRTHLPRPIAISGIMIPSLIEGNKI